MRRKERRILDVDKVTSMSDRLIVKITCFLDEISASERINYVNNELPDEEHKYLVEYSERIDEEVKKIKEFSLAEFLRALKIIVEDSKNLSEEDLASLVESAERIDEEVKKISGEHIECLSVIINKTIKDLKKAGLLS